MLALTLRREAESTALPRHNQGSKHHPGDGKVIRHDLNCLLPVPDCKNSLREVPNASADRHGRTNRDQEI